MNTQRVEGPKVCPFCGAIPEPFIPEGYEHGFDMRCNTEGCFLQHGADYSLDKDALIARWNLRNSNIERLEKVNEALVRALEHLIGQVEQQNKAYGNPASPSMTLTLIDSHAALKLAKEPA